MSDSIKQQKQVPNKELIIFLISTFLFTTMQGMVGNYRQAYLVNVLHLTSDKISLVNTVCNIICFALSFFYAMLIDRAPKPGKAKFKPVVTMAAIPAGLFTVLMFLTPNLAGTPLIAYLCLVTILHAAATYFANTINSIGIILSQNQAERDTVLTFRGIVNAIGNSAPLVVVLVVGLFKSASILATEERRFVFSAVLCSVVGTVMMLFAMRVVKERVVYSSKQENPLLGFRDIIRNPYAMLLLFSEFLQGLRQIGGYMGVFLAAALLGDVSKYILFGLPTGIGTFIGMLIVNRLLKKINSKQIYMLSAGYSMLANLGAFFAGLQSFRNPDSMLYQVIFFVFLFLIGLQYGATNLLPSMFQADILEDIEVKTHRRVEASLAFIIGVGGMLAGVITGFVSPRILLGESSFIKYLPPVDQLVDGIKQTVYLDQSYDTKVRMLLVYTIFHGLMILLASLPFFFYTLTGEKKERVHAQALAFREQLEK